MPRSYRPVDREQQFLMPPDMAEWLPEDHLAWFLIDVVDQVDTTAFHRRHPKAGPGRRAYDPDMLLALLMYSYAAGQRSSRRIETLCTTDVAFRVLCAQDVPDHSTIARFRAVHEETFEELFTRVLVLCAEAGMGKVGTVAIDGTKVAANAARSANRTEDSMRAEARRILEEAAATDAAEDEQFGDSRGDELPAQFAGRRGRAAKLKKALDEIDRSRDQEGQQDAPDRARADEYLRRVEAGETPPGSPPAGVDPVRLHRARMCRAERQAETAPPSTWARGNARRTARQARQQLEAAERAVAAGEVDLEVASARERRRKKRGGPAANLTDPQSRLMRTAHNGAIQGYNAQVVVSDDHLILATGLHQHGNDYHCYEPMAAAAEAATQSVIDAQPAPEKQTGLETILADAGYFTEDNLTSPGPDRLIALGKNHHVQQEAREHPAAGPPPADASPAEQMRHRLRTPEGAQTYKRRGATVEPVIGHLKDQIGLRRFSRRGLTAAGSELNLAATVVNLLKLHGRGTAHA